MQPHSRIHQLDLFRFCAAALVVAFHYLTMGPLFGMYEAPFPDIVPAARYGFYGVPLFFLISGFVIAMSAEGKTASEFLRARFCRLFPVFWVACTITFVGVKLAGPVPFQTSVAGYLASMTMVLPHFLHTPYVDGVYWTLLPEWLFYFAVAALLRFGHYDRYRATYLTIWLVVAMLLLKTKAGPLRTVTIAEYAPYFVAGAAFFDIYRGRATRHDVYNVLFSFLVALQAAKLRISDVARDAGYRLNETVVFLIIAGLFGLFTLLACHKLERLNRRAFLPLGALTYSFYLCHQNLGYAAISALEGSVSLQLATGVALVAAITLAAVLHYGVERPVHAFLAPAKK
ncbi:acyltransferase [Paraburkholderia sp. UCT31]|uniref:acyltransferase family protein n=1 Tax=Paraburkholderia sp. UCT31 TaxID=2615209 RepID=UPI001655C845|nr:acyltransferase [Paraburkholderia sp. UCT31]MBC8739805.1 acyltransferase [Paraburkholderia sp. UCT31]